MDDSCGQLVRYIDSRRCHMVDAAQKLTRFQDHLEHMPVSVRDGAEEGVVDEVKDVHSYALGTSIVPNQRQHGIGNEDA